MVGRKPAAGNRVREVRLSKSMTLDALAEKVGVHFTTIAKIERSQRRLSGELLVKISEALGVPPVDLVEVAPAALPVRNIPIIGRIAAGNWREAVLDPEGYIAIPLGGPNAFALRPEGDSMNLIAREGSLIVVDPDERDLLDGKLFAVMNGDAETTFKRFRADPPRLEPVSDNPIHKPIALGREPFTVIGRIVGHFAPL